MAERAPRWPDEGAAEKTLPASVTRGRPCTPSRVCSADGHRCGRAQRGGRDARDRGAPLLSRPQHDAAFGGRAGGSRGGGRDVSRRVDHRRLHPPDEAGVAGPAPALARAGAAPDRRGGERPGARARSGPGTQSALLLPMRVRESVRHVLVLSRHRGAATSHRRRSRSPAPSPMPPEPGSRSSSWPPSTPRSPPARPRSPAPHARSTRASTSTACWCGSARRRQQHPGRRLRQRLPRQRQRGAAPRGDLRAARPS